MCACLLQLYKTKQLRLIKKFNKKILKIKLLETSKITIKTKTSDMILNEIEMLNTIFHFFVKNRNAIAL